MRRRGRPAKRRVPAELSAPVEEHMDEYVNVPIPPLFPLEPSQAGPLIGRRRDVYICTPMCASTRVASSNIVYLGYGYRSTGTSVLNTEIDL